MKRALYLALFASYFIRSFYYDASHHVKVIFVLYQGQAIRGSDRKETSNPGNYKALLALRSDDISYLTDWMKRRNNWMSHDIQNEMLEIMSHAVLRVILTNIHSAGNFTVICDEADGFLSISLRWVDNQFVVYEDFLGFYELSGFDAKTITASILDVLRRFDLNVNNCRGQAYDGATTMSGEIGGVQAKIRDIEPRAVYGHCMAHKLELSLQDIMRVVPSLRDFLHELNTLINFILASPKRKLLLANLQQNESDSEEENDESEEERDSVDAPKLPDNAPPVTIKPLCPTRWTMRSGSLNSVLANYSVIMDMMQTLSETEHSDVGAKANGFLTSISQFKFLFCLKLSSTIFQTAELTSKVLQTSGLSISDGMKAIEQLKKIVTDLRTDAKFNTLFDECCCDQKTFNVDEPCLPRRRVPPRRLDQGSAPVQFNTPREMYAQLYFEILDVISSSLTDRFNQSSYKIALDVEKLIMDAANEASINQECLSAVTKHYGTDINADELKLNLRMLPNICGSGKISNITTVCESLNALGLASKLFSQICKLLKLFLLLPVTSATAERSFSAMRRLRNYLRKTMTTQRLNSCAILHVHYSLSGDIDMANCLREFICGNDDRLRRCGKVNVVN